MRSRLQQLAAAARRVAKKPPRYVIDRVWRDLRGQGERWLAPRRARALTPQELCRRLGATDIEELWGRCSAGPWPFLPDPIDGTEFDRLCPGERARIEQAAERALAGEIDLLGSGPLPLGASPDWLRDHKSGRRWAPAFSASIRYAELGQPSDVKVPWELSRLQWAIPLGQAFALTGDERYAQGGRHLLDAWISANPYAWTVNWSCTMEPAIRLLTHLWMFFALRHSQAFADEGFRYRLLRSLYLHGDYVERHIERSDLNGNHFTANAAGLVFIGLFFERGADARRWSRAGLTDLEHEIVRQVTPDGVDFEASVPYHRLVCELFALPAIYAEAHGRPVSETWRRRVGAMARFTAAYSRDDGSCPLWGDADDARALPMRQGHLNDHRYLVGLVADWLDDGALAERSSGPVEEIYWLRGPTVAAGLGGRKTPAREAEAFPDGGYYVLAGGSDHVFVDCAEVGGGGRGGHGHNDTLSFEATLDGVRLVTDSGCYLYTASVEERMLFRSTDSHNTPRVDGEEINRFVPGSLWALRDDVRVDVQRWAPRDRPIVLIAAHDAYRRLADPVTITRRFSLDVGSHTLVVDDSFDGRGDHHLEVPLHLAPGIHVDVAGSGYLVSAGERRFQLSWTGDPDWQVTVERSRVAPSYGVIEAARRVVWRRTGALPTRLEVTLAPQL